MLKHRVTYEKSSKHHEGSGDSKSLDSLAHSSQLNGCVISSDQQNTLDEEEDKINYYAARKEWDGVQNITPGSKPISQSQPISFNEALQYFQTLDLTNYMKTIKPSLHRSPWYKFKQFLWGPQKLDKELIEERDLVFAIGQCPFEDNQVVHRRVLQTIYKKLVGAKIDCARYGNHWEAIGFQGSDPSTDLRGTGFLGLMNILYLVMDAEILPLARQIYDLSQNETQNFPFCVMSINMARVAVQALREDVLNRECNQRKQVIAVLNDFYVGTILYLYNIWKKENKTIADSGYVLKDVENYAKKNPRDIIKNLKSYLEKRSLPAVDSPNINKRHEEKVSTFSVI